VTPLSFRHWLVAMSLLAGVTFEESLFMTGADLRAAIQRRVTS